MPTPCWSLQRELAEESGRAAAACDGALLEEALSYPFRKALTGEADVAALAASYAYGILECKPFAAGNAQAAFLALGLFLYLNDWRLGAPQDEAVDIMLAAASGRIDEQALADWIRCNL